MKQRTLDLIDYIGLGERKPWYQHGRMFYWWEFCWLVEFIVNRPLCFFGIHRAYDGLFHTCLDSDGDRDGFKCYHCRYCNKPADQEWHDQKID